MINSMIEYIMCLFIYWLLNRSRLDSIDWSWDSSSEFELGIWSSVWRLFVWLAGSSPKFVSPERLLSLNSHISLVCLDFEMKCEAIDAGILFKIALAAWRLIWRCSNIDGKWRVEPRASPGNTLFRNACNIWDNRSGCWSCCWIKLCKSLSRSEC